MSESEKLNYLRSLIKNIADLEFEIGQDKISMCLGESICFTMLEGDYCYCTPGWEQYGLGKAFPEDNKIKISIDVIDEYGGEVERDKLDFTLTYDLNLDTNSYIATLKGRFPKQNYRETIL